MAPPLFSPSPTHMTGGYASNSWKKPSIPAQPAMSPSLHHLPEVRVPGPLSLFRRGSKSGKLSAYPGASSSWRETSDQNSDQNSTQLGEPERCSPAGTGAGVSGKSRAGGGAARGGRSTCHRCPAGWKDRQPPSAPTPAIVTVHCHHTVSALLYLRRCRLQDHVLPCAHWAKGTQRPRTLSR
jgi:hypothetical protein